MIDGTRDTQEKRNMDNEEILLITGGTGSFGHASLAYALAQGVQEVWVLSRDEFEQEIMPKELHDRRVKFYLSNVRALASVDHVMEDVDYVFDAAAVKEMPPIQAVLIHALIDPMRVIPDE